MRVIGRKIRYFICGGGGDMRNLSLYGTNEMSVPAGTERVLHCAACGEISYCRGMHDLCHMPVGITFNICYPKVN